MRSITELKSWYLSEYLVETCSVGLNKSKWKKSVTSTRVSLWKE